MLRSSRLAPYEFFELEQIAGAAGTLYLAELNRRAGPPIARFFFLTGVPAGMRRGGHAHKDQAEYLVCIQGRLEVHIEAGGKREVIRLERPGQALYLPPGYWRDLVRFSDHAVLAVLATHAFSEDDYIRDRDDFLRWEASFAS